MIIKTYFCTFLLSESEYQRSTEATYDQPASMQGVSIAIAYLALLQVNIWYLIDLLMNGEIYSSNAIAFFLIPNVKCLVLFDTSK